MAAELNSIHIPSVQLAEPYPNRTVPVFKRPPAIPRFGNSRLITRKSPDKDPASGSASASSRASSATGSSGSVGTDEQTSDEWQTTDSSSDYDTDLETNLDHDKREKDPDRDVGQLTYSYACEDCWTAPQRFIYEGLSNKELSLAHRNLGPRGIKALCITLKKNLKVRHLDLSENGLGGRGAIYICSVLKGSDLISVANLSHNRMKLRGAVALGEMLKENRGLYSLNISHNDFEEEAGRWLAYGIENNDRLVELNVSHNNLCEKGAAFIGNALTVNDCIETLNLSWNHIRRVGAVTLCKGLAVNKSLTHVDLSWNGFGYEGALALGKMLKENKTLVDLDLRNNRINWQGALFLADGLKENHTLERLQLGGNPITTTGCMDLIEAVSVPGSGLTTLDLTGVPVIAEFEMMGDAIRQTRHFQFIHGGVVSSHDFLGQRRDKRVDPLQRVILYIREREIRPTELFRSFDKSVNQKITPADFARRIQNAGIPIPKYEMIELMEQIESSSQNKKRKVRRNKNDAFEINYQILITSVNNQIEKERNEKIQQRELEKRRQLYHEHILSHKLPPIIEADNAASILIDEFHTDSQPGSPKVGGLSRKTSNRALVGLSESHTSKVLSSAITRLNLSPGRANLTLAKPSTITRPKPKVISMSTQLGAKAKAFGAADVKKKRKKKRTGRKK